MASIHAVIELEADALRYVAYADAPEGPVLERLGSFDFAFDVQTVLLGDEAAASTDIITEAVAAAFGDLALGTVQVLLHPPVAHSFFVPVPSSARADTRERHLRQEAGLLLGASSGRGPVHVEATQAYRTVQQTKDPSLDWLHAVAIRQHVYERLAPIETTLETPIHVREAGSGVAHLLQVARQAAEASGEPWVAVGWYPTHLTCVVSRPEGGYFAHHTDAAPPADAGFLASTLVQRLDLAPAAVARTYLFGQVEDTTPFETLKVAFGDAPRLLDPLPILDVPQATDTPAFNRALYAPALGCAAHAAREEERSGDAHVPSE